MRKGRERELGEKKRKVSNEEKKEKEKRVLEKKKKEVGNLCGKLNFWENI